MYIYAYSNNKKTRLLVRTLNSPVNNQEQQLCSVNRPISLNKGFNNLLIVKLFAL